ncbi:glycosyltransferase family 4 protein [Fulvivirga lutimaris]|uniref:glycosyltransferase family 4 protein n=1 Tax=Fulvivirga lutimaris TaxID=1819566 RepID=UPI0012BD0157|nr:glycosyltransferase family 4 protein [Fulvivirga lutimaris]MTI40902.1 glycosyltransferase family 1 protein [Fulvivirga lutimaris]
MKIGMFLDTAFPPDSRVENEAISLIKAGHEVHLFSLDYDGRKSRETINGIFVHRYKADKLTYKLSALAYTFPFFHIRIKKSIIQFIDEVKPEAIHIHDMVIAKAVMNVNKDLLVVLDLHENRPEIMKHYKHVNEGLGKWLINTKKWNRVQDELIKRCDHLILVTEEAKQVATGKGLKNADQITVVPNTILPEVYLNYTIDQSIQNKFKDSFNLVYLGDTSFRRGTDTAIKSIALLKNKIPNVKLILVGDSSIDDQLKQLASGLNVSEYVSFEGWQDVSLFSSYVQASDICLSPLKRNTHHDTTFANKLFQYMAMGKPVVVSNSTTQANVVNSENCGLVFEAEDEKELADQVIKLYEDKELSKQLGANGKKAVKERWNWDITSKDLINMYSTLKDSL